MKEYDVASFLALNHEALKTSNLLIDAYRKATTIAELEEARMLIVDALLYTLQGYFKDVTIQELEAIVEEDKVNTVVHTLYLKGYYYEH